MSAGSDVKLALIGAGSRGQDSYLSHIPDSPYKVTVNAVAEPRDDWRAKAIEKFNIPPENAFSSWEELAAQPQLSDCALIATPDRLHAAPAMALMRRGYHLLLEKPMAATEADCREIIAVWRETHRILAVCHVMRYSSHARKVKQMLDDKLIGEITAIQHIEPVGYWHIAHSYVRGNWRREEESTPMLLAKSCHDLDLLRYWIGRPCRRVTSFGSLKYFRPDKRPSGAADRCLDCPAAIESQCPYSAVKIYMRDFRNRTGWPNNVLTIDTSPEGIEKALRSGPYGRCVFACDNDVVDHQVVNMEFDGGITVSFTMSGFTVAQDRETWIMGTHGQLRSGAGRIIEHTDFISNTTHDIGIDEKGDPTLATGHAGDAILFLNFIRAVAENDPAILDSDPEISLESHLIAFAAERARKNNSVEPIIL